MSSGSKNAKPPQKASSKEPSRSSTAPFLFNFPPVKPREDTEDFDDMPELIPESPPMRSMKTSKSENSANKSTTEKEKAKQPPIAFPPLNFSIPPPSGASFLPQNKPTIPTPAKDSEDDIPSLVGDSQDEEWETDDDDDIDEDDDEIPQLTDSSDDEAADVHIPNEIFLHYIGSPKDEGVLKNSFGQSKLSTEKQNILIALRDAGHDCLNNGRIGQALAFYKEALSIDCDAMTAYLCAFLNIRLHRFEEARKYAEDLLKAEPAWSKAHHIAGQVYFRLSRFQDAKHHFTRCSSLKPFLEDSSERVQKAREMLREGEDDDDDDDSGDDEDESYQSKSSKKKKKKPGKKPTTTPTSAASAPASASASSSSQPQSKKTEPKKFANLAETKDSFLLKDLSQALRSSKVEMVELLLSTLAPTVNFAGTEMELHCLASERRVDLLEKMLDRGADINVRHHTTAETPLHFAVTVGDVPTVRFLLSRGADINLTDSVQDSTPFHLACESGDLAVLKEFSPFITKEILNRKNKFGKAASSFAKKKDVRQFLQILETQTEKRREQELREREKVEKKEKATKGKETSSVQTPMIIPDNLPMSQTEETQTAPQAPVTFVKDDIIFATPRDRQVRLEGLMQSYLSGQKRPNLQHVPTEPVKRLNTAKTQVNAKPSDVVVEPSLHQDREALDQVISTIVSLCAPDEIQIAKEIVSANMDDFIWDILISRPARLQWTALSMSLKLAAAQQLALLARGQWTLLGDHAIVQVIDTPPGLKLLQSTFFSEDQFGTILWEVAPDFSSKKTLYIETIRVWCIDTSPEVIQSSIALAKASYESGRSSDINIKLSRQANRAVAVNGVTLPFTFNKLSATSSVNGDDIVVVYPPAEVIEDSSKLIKFYYISTELVQSVLLNRMDAEFEFRVSEEEHHLVHQQSDPKSSILLLGRSGTGKTTVAIMRLWRDYFIYWSSARLVDPHIPDGSGNFVHLHQVFITANPVLRAEVRRSFRALQRGHGFNVPDTPVPSSLSQLQEHSFPLFLTTREWLLLLDSALQKPFFERDADGEVIEEEGANGGWHEEVNMMEDLLDDDTVDHEDNNAHINSEATPVIRSHGRIEVTYNFFADTMWPKINSTKEYSYHPSLVFTEIFSYIKGSAESLESPDGRLNLADYKLLGRKRSPTFAGDREKVYEIYKKYEKLKGELGCFDVMDFVFYIYRNLRLVGYLGIPIHSIMHDEVQDFTQAELALDFLISADPNNLFFAGDTSQTIARGVGFRFSDLRSLFHYEQDLMQRLGPERPGQALEQVAVPKVQQLLVNYRTHAGILQSASAVVDLIHEHFPYSVDKLDHDLGFFKGPSPILFATCKPQDLFLVLVGKEAFGTENDRRIEFGAHQVILVRSQQAKANIPDELKSALIMTVFESKGLEFDDVFLYNFFEDSPANQEWRVVTDYLQARKNMTKTEPLRNSKQQQPRALKFDPTTHALLNEELKQLYTAITRARSHVYVFDANEDKRLPMFDFFHRLQLARYVDLQQFRDALPRNIAGIALPSSPAEWKKRGDNLFENDLFALAADCYEKSGDREGYLLALAYARVQEANKSKDQKTRSNLFLEAADLFLRVDRFLEAGRCLYSGRHFQLASELFTLLQRPLDTARCYRAMNEFAKAADAYLEGKQPLRALQQLREAKLYDRCIQLLDEYKHIPEMFNQREEYVYLAAQHHLKSGNKEAMLLALAHLEDQETQITFLRRSGCWEELVGILVKRGSFKEAASILVERGRYAEAALILADHPEFELLVGRYYIKHSMLLWNKHDSASNIEAELYLTKAKDQIKVHKDAPAFYYVTEMLGHLKVTRGNLVQAQPLLREAFHYYSQQHSIIGQMTAFMGMIQAAGHPKTLHDARALVQSLTQEVFELGHFAMNLLRSFVIPVKSRSDRQRQLIANAESFFGVEQHATLSNMRLIDKVASFFPILLLQDEVKNLAEDFDDSKYLSTAVFVEKVLARHTYLKVMTMMDLTRKYILTFLEQHWTDPICSTDRSAIKTMGQDYPTAVSERLKLLISWVRAAILTHEWTRLFASKIDRYVIDQIKKDKLDIHQDQIFANIAKLVDAVWPKFQVPDAYPACLESCQEMVRPLGFQLLSMMRLLWDRMPTEARLNDLNAHFLLMKLCHLCHRPQSYLSILVGLENKYHQSLPRAVIIPPVRILRDKPLIKIMKPKPKTSLSEAERLFMERFGDSDDEPDMEEIEVIDENAPDEYDVIYPEPPARIAPRLPNGLFWMGRKATTSGHIIYRARRLFLQGYPINSLEALHYYLSTIITTTDKVNSSILALRLEIYSFTLALGLCLLSTRKGDTVVNVFLPEFFSSPWFGDYSSFFKLFLPARLRAPRPSKEVFDLEFKMETFKSIVGLLHYLLLKTSVLQELKRAGMSQYVLQLVICIFANQAISGLIPSDVMQIAWKHLHTLTNDKKHLPSNIQPALVSLTSEKASYSSLISVINTLATSGVKMTTWQHRPGSSSWSIGSVELPQTTEHFFTLSASAATQVFLPSTTIDYSLKEDEEFMRREKAATVLQVIFRLRREGKAARVIQRVARKFLVKLRKLAAELAVVADVRSAIQRRVDFLYEDHPKRCVFCGEKFNRPTEKAKHKRDMRHLLMATNAKAYGQFYAQKIVPLLTQIDDAQKRLDDTKRQFADNDSVQNDAFKHSQRLTDFKAKIWKALEKIESNLKWDQLNGLKELIAALDTALTQIDAWAYRSASHPGSSSKIAVDEQDEDALDWDVEMNRRNGSGKGGATAVAGNKPIGAGGKSRRRNNRRR